MESQLDLEAKVMGTGRASVELVKAGCMVVPDSGKARNCIIAARRRCAAGPKWCFDTLFWSGVAAGSVAKSAGLTMH
jgi:hypothetical protein